MSQDSAKRGSRGQRGRGAFKYANFEDNHVIWPGSTTALNEFVNKPLGERKHKLKNAHSSNSEDALTWSCFNTLKQISIPARRRALSEIWELAFQDSQLPDGLELGDIHVGKRYPKHQADEISTEVDASIESRGALVFIEAKLYSPMSPADPENKSRRKEYDQIALKLRIGASEAAKQSKDFYFILLDVAPMESLRSLGRRATLEKARNPRGASGFAGKWRTAYWFARYKYGRRGSLSPLIEILSKRPAITHPSAKQLAKNMGWLTWADVYKAVLRAVIPTH